jgi:hypothetical protein
MAFWPGHSEREHHRLGAPSRPHRRSTERGRSSFLAVLSDEPLQYLGQLEHAGEILLGENSVLTLSDRAELRAADRRPRAYLVAAIGARFHEAHLDRTGHPRGLSHAGALCPHARDLRGLRCPRQCRLAAAPEIRERLKLALQALELFMICCAAFAFGESRVGCRGTDGSLRLAAVPSGDSSRRYVRQ